MDNTCLPILTVRDVCKTYGGVRAVWDMSLEVGLAEVVALIGPNGAGKTTLFNLISGLAKPDRGELLIGTTRATGLPSWKMAELGVGRTFQNIRLFGDLTVIENVALAQKGHPLSTLELAQVEPLLARMGLMDCAGTLAKSLSYGVRRRVELARALAGKPKLMLLDEPTAGMNPVESLELVGTIQELASSGLAVLLIEHNMQVAMRVAQRVVVMSLGQKLAEGTAEAIRMDERVIEAYLGES